MTVLEVRTISFNEHRAYVAARPRIPLEQTPGWAKVFVTVRYEAVGWFEDDVLIGAGLFRYRGLPRIPQRSVAIFDAGPDIDWTGARRPSLGLDEWLSPLVDHLRSRGVFTARINPPVNRRTWVGVSPTETSTSREVVPARPSEPDPMYAAVTQRLRETRWRPLSSRPAHYVTEVGLHAHRGAAGSSSTSHELLPGITLREGSFEDLAGYQRSLRQRHPDIRVPRTSQFEARWQGLSEDDVARVRQYVAERDGEVLYGGMMAVVGDRAWDLSPSLPLPDASLPEVQIVRRHMLEQAARLRAHWLVVPTAWHPGAQLPTAAAGWPPVRLRETMGTWHYPVRATWHTALAPLVDRFNL